MLIKNKPTNLLQNMVHITDITQLSKHRGRYCGEYEDRHERLVVKLEEILKKIYQLKEKNCKTFEDKF